MRLWIVLAALVHAAYGLAEGDQALADELLANQGAWTDWTDCSASCGGGVSVRSIKCYDTLYGRIVDPCREFHVSCNSVPCPEDPDYIAWQDWTVCSAECGGGTRSRTGLGNDGVQHSETIKCGMQSCEALDPYLECGKANVMFVVDSSYSVGADNWYKVKQWVIDVVSALKVSNSETHVGVTLYSTQVKQGFQLDTSYDPAKLEQLIWDMPYLAGVTNTGAALQAVLPAMQQARRPDVKDIVVLLSDGRTNVDEDSVIAAAQALKDDGVTIFSVGVNKRNFEELKAVCSEPIDNHYMGVEKFSELQDIIDSIVGGACDVSQTVECDDWSEWSVCPVSCGGGQELRSRVCRLVDSVGTIVKDGIVKEDSRECATEDCVADITTTTAAPTTTLAPTEECDDWPEWGICSISCGGPVQQVRTRDCRSINHLGEVISVKTDEDYQECGSVKCPEEICRDWVETVPCPISCGGPAEATFSQTCDLVDWAGTVLESNTIEEVRICAELACPETICPEWGSFDPCPLSCGGPVTHTRMRTCDIMDHSGANIGSILETDTQECGNIACPSEVCEDWPEWAACSVSCGGPVEQIRSRDCNMVDHLGNIASTRTEEEFRQCGFVSCPEEVCKEWIEFQPCPISCGGPAEEKFTRVCDMVDWMGTVVSSETVEEVRVCADFPCPEVVCPEYRAYPECPVSCEGATQTRSRTCNLVDHEGNIMEEISESEEVICNNFACPTTVCPEYVDYPACPVSCEGAEQTRTRTCEIIDHTGALVETVEESESQICNNFACPNTVCPDYEEYPACPVTCAGIEQTRTRTCQTFDYKGALVEAFIESETQICNNFACPSKVCPEYVDYPVCPVSCAGAEQTRTRTCEIIDHTGALVETVEESESQICNNFACPSKVCPEYVDYPVCPVSCAGAEQTRTRTCEIIDHAGALVETVEESESQICNNFACPNTVCPDYEEYPACPVTCAGIEQTRTRTCQTFDYKGALLEAFIESETQICNNFACPSKNESEVVYLLHVKNKTLKFAKMYQLFKKITTMLDEYLRLSVYLSQTNPAPWVFNETFVQVLRCSSSNPQKRAPSADDAPPFFRFMVTCLPSFFGFASSAALVSESLFHTA
ncbi:hypothetical protein CAPTEDRAFT_198363 [Capitella teleta]|uniref:VWFA domain-containing protein n=1 Tax=Capitella teleta TaxID=283909 RepID=R7T8E0_CAPTE|nr:hypothetical protein CAPTEDRAFT_198363 [Capitella teleta]|eukprot:ELT89949.1 hypothetical protein CAPTEDRAFT_198363 [Capitella teleta]